MTSAETLTIDLDGDQVQAVFDNCKQLFLGFLNDSERDTAINSIYTMAALILEQFQSDQQAACGTGCTYCCHRPVLVTMAEADIIARTVAALPPGQRADLEKKIRITARTLPSERAAKGLHPDNACPLLGDEGECRVYDVRPLACRSTASFSIEKCRDHYDRQNSDVFSSSHGTAVVAEIIRQAINAALDEYKGQKWAEIYELISAVDVLID